MKYRSNNTAMKPELMDIIACPVCKRNLTLVVEVEEGGEIITGHRIVPRVCEVSYYGQHPKTAAS